MATPATPPATFNLAATATPHASPGTPGYQTLSRDDKMVVVLEMIVAQLQQIRVNNAAFKTSFDTQLDACITAANTIT